MALLKKRCSSQVNTTVLMWKTVYYDTTIRVHYLFNHSTFLWGMCERSLLSHTLFKPKEAIGVQMVKYRHAMKRVF